MKHIFTYEPELPLLDAIFVLLWLIALAAPAIVYFGALFYESA